MPRRIFTACLGTETNSHSPLPTGLRLFEETLLIRNGAYPDASHAHLAALPVITWRNNAKARGWEVAEGLVTFATPAGETTSEAFAALRDEILDALRAALPVDAVLLNLHGAMIAAEAPDAEGALLAAVRRVVGPDVPLLAELDLHGHLTRLKLESTDAMIFYKEYPHTDVVDRAHELFALAERMVEDGLRPAQAAYDCRMLGLYPTTREPMQSFVARMAADFERRPGVLSVSLVHGFPWGDTPEVGTAALAVTDADPALAASVAREMGEWAWEHRDEILPPFVGLPAAVQAILGAPAPSARGTGVGPLVVADTADNAGGGAAADSTFVLAELLKAKARGVALSPLWDPSTVGVAFGAGAGARLMVRLGGKLGPDSGDPLDVAVEVRGLRRGATQPFGPGIDAMGDAAWLRILPEGASRGAAAEAGAEEEEGLDVVVTSKRTQGFHPDCFAQVGLDPLARRALVVKSAHHFYSGFGAIAGEVMWARTEGTLTMDFLSVGRKHKLVEREMWPAVAEPTRGPGPPF